MSLTNGLTIQRQSRTLHRQECLCY